MAFIQSFGAAETVTGSCHLLQIKHGPNILIDCGYYQGEQQEKNYQPFDFNPKDVDIILLTHAHLYPLPIEMLCSVANSDCKTRRNMMTMASPYQVLQRRIAFRASDPQGKF